MSSYAEKKAEEKRKQLTKVEQQLSDLTRLLETLKVEIAAFEDVVAHSAEEKRPVRKTKSKRGKSKSNGKVSHAAPVSVQEGGHWPHLIAKYAQMERFTLDDVERDLKALGQRHVRKSIRAKLTKLVGRGTLRRESDGVFSVASRPRGVSGAELRAAGLIPQHAKVVGET